MDGLREDDPSDDGDGEEDREELDRRGRHGRPPRLPDPRQAARIRGCAGADMGSADGIGNPSSGAEGGLGSRLLARLLAPRGGTGRGWRERDRKSVV